GVTESSYTAEYGRDSSMRSAPRLHPMTGLPSYIDRRPPTLILRLDASIPPNRALHPRSGHRTEPVHEQHPAVDVDEPARVPTGILGREGRADGHVSGRLSRGRRLSRPECEGTGR